MSARSLAVVMNGARIGTLTANSAGTPTLVYADDVVDDENAVGLSLSLPTVGRKYTGTGLNNWLRGLLPDRSEVLARWRREFGVRKPDAFSLLWHVGEDVAGAAQFVRPDRLEHVLDDDAGELTAVSDDDVAGRLAGIRADRAAWGTTASLGQFSLAGAQAKFTLARDESGQWLQPTGRQPSTHIVKPAMADLTDQDLNEHLSMRTAAALGFAVPDTQVLAFAGERALVIERFDRLQTDSGWVRMHQEDLCQAAGHSPDAKFETQGGPGVARIAALLTEALRPTDRNADLLDFVRMLALNWVIVGTDAHAKNYALLHVPGQSRLAPLYDVNSFLPYGDPSGVELAMTIGTYHRRPTFITAADWAHVARTCGLDRDRVLEAVAAIATGAGEAAAVAAADPDLAHWGSALPARFAAAVAAYADECTSRLTGRP